MWGTVMGMLKDEKVSLGILGLIAFIMFRAYGWMDVEFIRRTQAQDATEAIQKSVDSMSQMLKGHISDYTIGEAVKEVEQLEGDLWYLKLTASYSGETEETVTLERELRERLRHAVSYRDCLLDNRPNCKHLTRNR